MRLATLFSGIGAPEVAAKRLGWECLWGAEIEPFPSAVLAFRHPESVNLGDVTAPDFCERALSHGKPDVLVFGSPCQSFSVAGKRAGVDDPRGVLAFVALGIVARIRPTWFVFENVPGLLSSNAGRDFGAFLRAVDECGYSGAWASPDAQFFGVPQRRERVFFIGHSGDWRYPAAVLSEFSRLCGHPPPSREKGEGTSADVAPSIGASGRGTERAGESRGQDPVIAVYGGNNTGGPIEVATGCNHHPGRYDFESETLVAFTCKDSGNDSGEVSPPLRAMGADKSHANAGGQMAVAFQLNGDRDDPGVSVANDVAFTLPANPMSDRGQAVAQPLRGNMYNNSDPGMEATMHVYQGMSVRRLTPRECERLQGFDDGYTAITYKNKPAADGPRYKAIGNSMAVPVLEDILGRIETMMAPTR
jgi:DNA (cytosine-5)-methyltransferase 1